MKRVPFDLFGPGQFLYFDIGRLIQVENLSGKSAGDIIKNQDLNLGILTMLLSVGLKQHGLKQPGWFAEKMQTLLEEGHELEEFTLPVVKALAGSGILGKAVYYTVFPDEMTKDAEAEVAAERKK